MIADILAYIDGRCSADNAAEAAFLLAARFGARVEGLHVRVDAHDYISREPLYSNVLALAQFSESFDRQALALEELAQASFTAARGHREGSDTGPESGIDAHWTVRAGRPAELVCRRGRVADITVIGRGGYGPKNPTNALIEAALLDTGGPVLVAPPHVPTSVGRSVVIAWNRSAASAKAVNATLPLLDRADHVRLVYVDTGAKPGPSVAEAAAHLAHHGIVAEAVTLPLRQRSVASVLLADAVDADLLVIGAYSHTRFRDIVFGRVTRDVLDNATLPLMMVH